MRRSSVIVQSMHNKASGRKDEPPSCWLVLSDSALKVDTTQLSHHQLASEIRVWGSPKFADKNIW